MFTGDRSGQWLYRALHKAGFANQPESLDAADGLELINCTITNICRCAPPGNKPLPEELSNCQPFFAETLTLCQSRVIVALGGLAWRATLVQLMESGWLGPVKPRPKFTHGALVELSEGRWLLGSYHPSQQNTFTGKLTRKMLDDVFRKAKNLISS
jgi:uracil-DNA glycosylase family 4